FREGADAARDPMDELSEEAKLKQMLVFARARRLRGIKQRPRARSESTRRAKIAAFAAEVQASLIRPGLQYFLIWQGKSKYELWTSRAPRLLDHLFCSIT
ncbi:MAG: hypothetical protein ACREC4_03345, partial [Methylocella sp.]